MNNIVNIFSKDNIFEKIKSKNDNEIKSLLLNIINYYVDQYNEENTNKRIQEVINVQNSKEIVKNKINEKNNKLISEFKNTFFRINNREALDSEIIDNLKDKIEISILLKIIESQKSDSLV